MFCKNCGSNIDDNAVVCPRCGVQVGEVKPKTEEGNTIAIAGFVLAFFIPIAGLICSIIGRKRAKNSGAPYGGFALAGIIISAIDLVLSVVLIIIYISVIVAAASTLPEYGYLLVSPLL